MTQSVHMRCADLRLRPFEQGLVSLTSWEMLSAAIMYRTALLLSRDAAKRLSCEILSSRCIAGLRCCASCNPGVPGFAHLTTPRARHSLLIDTRNAKSLHGCQHDQWPFLRLRSQQLGAGVICSPAFTTTRMLAPASVMENEQA